MRTETTGNVNWKFGRQSWRRVARMERKRKWKMEMTGDRGRDNDDDDGDLAVCLEIILQLPAIRLQTRAEHNVSQGNQIN